MNNAAIKAAIKVVDRVVIIPTVVSPPWMRTASAISPAKADR